MSSGDPSIDEPGSPTSPRPPEAPSVTRPGLLVLSFGKRTLGFLLGLGLSVPVHVLGIVAGMTIVLVLGLAPHDASWPQGTQDIFVISFGLWQWIYLAPAILVLRARRAFGIGWGVAVSGLLMILFSAIGFAEMVFRRFS